MTHRNATTDDLLCAFHVVDLDGQGSGLGGHITARTDDPRGFYCHAFGLAFDEVGADDILRVAFDLRVLEGAGKVNPTLTFHSRIYAARPDVRCIVHTHADAITELTAAGVAFELVPQLAGILHEDWALLDEYDGVILDATETDPIVLALGAKRVLLLKNHGLVSVGTTIGEAVIGALVAESSARVQLAALAAGGRAGSLGLPGAGAIAAKRFLAAAGNTLDRWNMLKRRAQRARPDYISASVLVDAQPQ